MPKHLANLAQGRARAQEPGGEAMAEQVRAFHGWMESRAIEGPPDNRAHGSPPGKAPRGGASAQEDASSPVVRPIRLHGQSSSS